MKKLVFVLFATVSVGSAVAMESITPGWDNINDERRFREPAKLIWQASIADGSEVFDVAYMNGATGKLEYANGKLVVEKTNAAGYLAIAVKKGFSSKAGTKLRNFLDMEVIKADSEYSLGFARISNSRTRLPSSWGLDAVGIFMGGGKNMAYLVNTAPNVAERRFSHYVVPQENTTNLTPVVVIAGAPSLVKIVRWGVEDYERAQSAWIRERGKYIPKYDHKRDLVAESDFVQRLVKEREHTAKVIKTEQGRVKLMVDGKEELPFIFKHPHSWGRYWGDYNGRAMSRAGLRLQTIGVGGRLNWTGGKWDRARVIKDIDEQMRCVPDAYYIISFDATASREYSAANQSEIMRHPDGSPIWGDWGKSTAYHYNGSKREMPTNCWPWISMSSGKYLDYMKVCLGEMIDDLKATGLSKRVIGIHFCGWHDGQFAPYRADFSECARRGFIDYLRANGEKVSDDFKLPVPNKGLWFDGKDAELMHKFSVYQHIRPFRVLEALAGVAKEKFAKDIVTLHWSMGIWGGKMNCAHYLEEFCRSKVMDIIVPQPSYTRRLPGNSVGVLPPVDSFALHGKLLVDELDLRAYGLIAGYLKEPSMPGLGHAIDFAQWQSINRKMVGRMFARRHGLWYYDISGGFYNPSEITADIGDAARAGRELLAKSPASAWRPSAAMVVDEKGMLWRNSVGNADCPEMVGLIDGQSEILAGSGVPYETWAARDVMARLQLLDDIKVVVLGGFFRLDDARVKFVRSLLDAGKTVVVLSGFCDDSWRQFGVAAKLRAEMQAPEIVPETGFGHLEVASHFHCEWMRWSLGVNGGDIVRLNRPPSFSFEEGFSDAKTLARYASDSLPAIIRKGKLIAIGQSCGLTAHFFNRIVRASQGYVPVESGVVQVDMNGDFISVHALATGVFDFKLPYRCKVVNLKTALPAEVQGDKLKLRLVAGETCWFRLDRQR